MDDLGELVVQWLASFWRAFLAFLESWLSSPP